MKKSGWFFLAVIFSIIIIFGNSSSMATPFGDGSSSSITSIFGDEEVLLLEGEFFNPQTYQANGQWYQEAFSWEQAGFLGRADAMQSASLTILHGGVGFMTPTQLFLENELLGFLTPSENYFSTDPAEQNLFVEDVFDLTLYEEILLERDVLRFSLIPFMTGNIPDEYTVQFSGVELKQRPIPEPATVLLFGLGLIGFAGVTRRSFRE